MTLRINNVAPNFQADTTEGPIDFHDWIGNEWAILFSHPKDFTPVCTTELGAVAGLKAEFERRNCKVLGISVDGVRDHQAWSKDIERSQGHALNYPLVGDPELKVVKQYDMLPAEAGGHQRGSDPDGQRHGAFGLRDRSGQADQSHPDLPDEHGPQLCRDPSAARLDPADRHSAGCDTGELGGWRRRDHPAGDLQRGGEREVSGRVGGTASLHPRCPAAEVGAAADNSGRYAGRSAYQERASRARGYTARGGLAGADGSR